MNTIQKFDGELIEQQPVIYKAADEPQSSSTTDMLKGILRRWHIALLVFLIMTVVGLPFIWLVIKPLYDVTGAIRVAPILRNIVTGQTDQGGISNYENFMNTQAEIIISDRVTQRVADDLSGKNLRFFNEQSNRFIKKIRNRLDNAASNQDTDAILREAINNKVIIVEPARKTELIKITVKSNDTKEPEQIVNSFIDNYIAVHNSNVQRDGVAQLEQLKKYQRELEEKIKSERQQLRAVQEFVTTASGGRKDLTLQEQMSILSSELTKVEADTIKIETKIRLSEQVVTRESAADSNNRDPNISVEMSVARVNYINANQTVQSLMKIVQKLEFDLLIAKQTYAPENPELKQKQEVYNVYKSRLDEQKRLIGEQYDKLTARSRRTALIRNLPENLFLMDRADYESKKELENRLKDRIEEIKSKMDLEDIQTINVGMKQLDIGDVDFQIQMDQQSLKQVVQRIEELEMEIKQPARIDVAYYANIAATRDKRDKFSLSLIVGAAFCGLMVALIKDRTDKTIYSADELVKRIGVRVIGTTIRQQDIEPAMLSQRIEQDYQTIWANLGLINDGPIPKELVITSPGRSEGKTTLAIHLATSIAKSGKKVLLIDGDLRKPSIARMLNIENGDKGLHDVLSGMPYSKVVFNMPESGLDVLVANAVDESIPLQLLTLPKTVSCIRKFAEIYDHVIIDTPPLLSFPDALIWAKIADAVILTSFAGLTSTKDLEEAGEKIRQVNARLLGTVLGNVHSHEAFYRYGSGYHAADSDKQNDKFSSNIEV
jgi:succinoglycan biosynthesis transport protein ExoP